MRPCARHSVSAAATGKRWSHRGAPIDGRRLDVRRQRRSNAWRREAGTGLGRRSPRSRTADMASASVRTPAVTAAAKAPIESPATKAGTRPRSSVRARAAATPDISRASWRSIAAPVGPRRCRLRSARRRPGVLAAIRRRAHDVWSSLLPCLGCAVLARYRAQQGAQVCPAASARGYARTSPPCARR